MMKLIEPYKWVGIALISLLLLAIIGLGFWRGMAVINGMVETARVEATELANAKWRAEIEKSNAEVAVKAATQAVQAAVADGTAQLQIAALKTQLSDLETENESLPAGACGLDSNRVRLLNK